MTTSSQPFFFNQVDTDVSSQRREGRFSPTKSARIGSSQMASVNQDGKLNRPGTAKVNKGIHGGPDGSAGKENIVDKDHFLLIKRERDVRFFYLGFLIRQKEDHHDKE
jgi:hypothetical protein